MNLKRMWCDYTCNPNKAKFVAGLGYQNDTDPLVGLETLTQFTLDPDYACILFQSCQKVSLIAQASLQSSIAFLDFMGFNGKQQSHSVIGFEFSKDPNASLNSAVFPCSQQVPTNGNFSNYTGVGNCSCAACDQACPAPSVDASIGFFDGFDGVLVLIVYLVLVVFSIAYQLIRKKFFPAESMVSSEEPEVQNEDPANTQSRRARKDKINESAISSNMSRVENSAQRLIEGRRDD